MIDWLAAAPPAQVSPAPLVGGPSAMRVYALRLRPGEDLRQALLDFARARQLKAAVIVSAVGSLQAARLRFADRHEPTALTGKFEIVSLVGTLSDTSAHLHLSIADGDGRTLGGHMVDGCTVYTTCELAIAELDDLRFDRAPEPLSGYRELIILPR